MKKIKQKKKTVKPPTHCQMCGRRIGDDIKEA